MPAVREDERTARYQHAARELERFARLRLYDSVDPKRIDHAKRMVRLAIGLRRLVDQWPPTS